jgi:hypothetical protein
VLTLLAASFGMGKVVGRVVGRRTGGGRVVVGRVVGVVVVVADAPEPSCAADWCRSRTAGRASTTCDCPAGGGNTGVGMCVVCVEQRRQISKCVGAMVDFYEACNERKPRPSMSTDGSSVAEHRCM